LPLRGGALFGSGIAPSDSSVHLERRSAGTVLNGALGGGHIQSRTTLRRVCQGRVARAHFIAFPAMDQESPELWSRYHRALHQGLVRQIDRKRETLVRSIRFGRSSEPQEGRLRSS